jgi:N-methylhydantoinase A/oxoprolinase/acetone carboxylase beta subunit
MKYRLGVDVGGTNTDAVLIDENLQVVSQVKAPTTKDVHSGILEAVKEILRNTDIDKRNIKRAMLGTTQCTNAIVERKNLAKVGVLRIGAPATMGIVPMIDWADDLKEIAEEVAIIGGGYEHNGVEIAPFDDEAAKKFFERCKAKHIESVAISSVFSTVRDDHENKAAEICRDVMGSKVHISLSSKIGNMGLIERENATILNAALHKVSQSFIEGFTQTLHELGVTEAAPYFSQNDGTLMTAELARKYPILTIACGPTNSIRGASYLSKYRNAIIIDVGGTTTDVGILQQGFPRESSIAVTIGGVRTNFRMPDVVSFGLGGGSIVRGGKDNVTVGPDSVGYQITQKALVFGGDIMTATDIAVRLGYADIGDASKVAHIEKPFAEAAMAKIIEMVEDHIDEMKMSHEDVDVILVGGGSILLPAQLAGAKTLVKPENFAVANAIGAAISKVSGTYEKLISYDETPREKAIETAKKEAIDAAVEAGASPETVEIIDVEDVPLQYYAGNMNRVKAKAAGDLR